MGLLQFCNQRPAPGVYQTMESPTTDREIVRRVLDGEVEEYRALVKRYKGLVYHISRYMISNEMDREDLGQEVFLKIYQNLPLFRFRSGLATWISRITYNTCLNYLRQRQSHPQESLDNLGELEDVKLQYSRPETRAVPTQEPTPDVAVMKKETAEFVRQTVRMLPVQYRAIVALHYLEEFNLREISKTVGMPVGTVKSYLFRARKMLKDRLLAKFKPEDLYP